MGNEVELIAAVTELCSRIKDGRACVNNITGYTFERAYGMAEKQAERVQLLLNTRAATPSSSVQSTARKVVDAVFARADAAYYDHRGTHVMFIQVYDEHDKRGPQPTNLGILSREEIAAIISAELSTKGKQGE